MLAPGTSIAELQALPRWVGWRFEPRKAGGRPTKVPFAPNSGRPAKANNSATWGGRLRRRRNPCCRGSPSSPRSTAITAATRQRDGSRLGPKNSANARSLTSRSRRRAKGCEFSASRLASRQR